MKKTFPPAIMLMTIVIMLFSCHSNQKENNTKDKEIIPNHTLVKDNSMEIIENNESDMQWDNISRQSLTIEGYPLSKSMKLLVGKTGSCVIIEGLSYDPVMYIAYRPDDVWDASVDENRRKVIEKLKQFYDFTVESETKELDIYTLTDYDDKKLRKTGDDVAGTSVKTVNQIKSFSNYDFDFLMQALEKEFDVIFRSDVNDESKYNFEHISMEDAEQAMKDLYQKYGMEFNQSKETVDVKVVTFK